MNRVIVRLIRTLERVHALYAELLASSQEKTDHLVKCDVAAIEAAQSHEELIVHKLAQIEPLRDKALADAGEALALGGESPTISAIAAALGGLIPGDDGEVPEAWGGTVGPSEAGDAATPHADGASDGSSDGDVAAAGPMAGSADVDGLEGEGDGRVAGISDDAGPEACRDRLLGLRRGLLEVSRTLASVNRLNEQLCTQSLQHVDAYMGLLTGRVGTGGIYTSNGKSAQYSLRALVTRNA